MAPPKSRSDSLSDRKTRSSSSSSLKQGRLLFTAAKPRAAGKGKKGTDSPQLTLSRQVSFDYEDDSTSSDSDREPRAIVTRNITRPRELTSKAGIMDGGVPDVSQTEDAPQGDLYQLEKSKRLNKVHNDARNRMGNMNVVHGEGQNKLHQILRVFDLSYEYGPCVGVTRLERWERAHELGLSPPPEIREMLLTKQGIEKDEYKHPVFYGEVV